MNLTLYESVTNSILEYLTRGVVPWRKPWSASHSLPINAITSRPYRGVNVFLLSASPFADHRWLTFKQAQELGGRVKAGEKSRIAVFWKLWEPTPDESEEDIPPKRRIPVLRSYNVFNAEQCEGLKLAARFIPEPLPEATRIERADLLARMMPNPPQIQEHGSRACYRPADDLVQVPPFGTFSTPDSYYQTLFHELGHATGHINRLNRSGVTGVIQFGSETYSQEELVAELTAAFCCATVDLDNSLLENAASYINGWLSVLRGDPKAVVIAAAQAQRAADYIKGVTYQG